MTESKDVVLQAQTRGAASRGVLRKMRLAGWIPGVLYGKGTSTPIALSTTSLPKHHTRSSVVRVALDGQEKKVLMREVQVDALTDAPLHFDLQEVFPGDKIRAHVPLNFFGLTREQEKEGNFTIRARYLEVATVLENLPEKIDVDVSQLKGGQSLFLFDLTMPKGVAVKTGQGKNVALASIVK